MKVANSDYKKTQVWELKVPRNAHRNFVKSLDSFGAINIWKEDTNTMEIMVKSNRMPKVASLLRDNDIKFSVAVADVDSLWEKEQGDKVENEPKTKQALTVPSMDWEHYHRLNTVYAFMDNLAKEFPYLVSVHVIGRTAEGRDLKMLKISNGNPENEAIWVDAAIHAREWISVSVATYLAEQLARQFNTFSTGVIQRDWYILPVMNPDGYEYTHTTDRMWRKNRTRYGECVGVDLNRNFSYAWGSKGEEGSSNDPGNIFYRGPDAFSEPETVAVKGVILNSDTRFKAFISLHSYGEVVIFPWGHTSHPCPDYVALLEGGAAMAKAIYEVNGHTYKVGSTKDLMYYAAGTSIDWAYGIARIPFCYMLELRGKEHRFLVPKEEIITTAKEALQGIITLIETIPTESD